MRGDTLSYRTVPTVSSCRWSTIFFFNSRTTIGAAKRMASTLSLRLVGDTRRVIVRKMKGVGLEKYRTFVAYVLYIQNATRRA